MLTDSLDSSRISMHAKAKEEDTLPEPAKQG